MEHNSSQQGLNSSVNGQVNNETKRSSIVPPYWKRQRGDSSSTIGNAPSTRITLEDHTEEPSDKSTALWAKSVAIDDYVVVSGSRSGVGAYVVWNCTVETLEGGVMTIRKRYSEFAELRDRLLKTFPSSGAAMPQLPSKSFFCRHSQTNNSVHHEVNDLADA